MLTCLTILLCLHSHTHAWLGSGMFRAPLHSSHITPSWRLTIKRRDKVRDSVNAPSDDKLRKCFSCGHADSVAQPLMVRGFPAVFFFPCCHILDVTITDGYLKVCSGCKVFLSALSLSLRSDGV